VLEKESPFENNVNKMFKYYIENPNYDKSEVKEPPVYHTATCGDMKRATDITDAKSIGSVVELHVV